MLRSVFKGLSLIIFAFSCDSFASSISGLNNASAPALVLGQVNKLIINAPNAHGISYNKVDGFSIDKKLVVIPKNNLPNSSTQVKLNTIIIHASAVSLNSEIVLASQDSPNLIIIVDKKAGKLSCTNCQFSGFPRVTLATANSSNTLNSSISKIGTLNNISSSSISINNLSAPDANSVEFHSESINTAGKIDSVFYAKKISGEYILSTSGDVGVNAGFNFFIGPLHVSYSTHEIVKSFESLSSNNSFTGKIHGAGISIVSARPLTIANGTTLTTQSDIAASGHVGEQFFIPTGNIDIVTTSSKPTYGKVINNGSVLSDAAVNFTTADLVNNGMITSKKSELVIENTFKNTGYFEATSHIELASRYVDNRKSIGANSLTIHADDAFFNHLGGRVLGNIVSVETKYFINGSRVEKAPDIKKQSILSLEKELIASADYGIFNSNSFSKPSSPVSDVSAHISAVNLSITAEQIENINPYFRERNYVEIWDGNVVLDYAKSRRVSIKAQNFLNLYSQDYIVNSSAILGLDNNGTVTINTPIFQNERYRFDTEGYIFARKTQNSTEEKHRSIGEEVETHVDAVSPMGTFYSFGRLNYSPISSTASTTFSNLMSFMQVHGKSNFYNTNFSSIAIMTSSQSDARISTSCIINRCAISSFQDNYTQTTFTSFLNDVDGLSSDVLVETKVSVVDYLQQYVDKYIEEYVQQEKDIYIQNGGALEANIYGPKSHMTPLFYFDTRKDEHTYTGDTLVITIYTCKVIEDGEGFPERRCNSKEHAKSINVIATDAAKGGIVPGTEQTDEQLKQMAKIHLGNMNTAGSVQQRFDHNSGEPDIRTVYGFWGNVLSSYEVGRNSSGQIEITLRYYERFYADEALTNFVNDALYKHSQIYTKKIAYSTFKQGKPAKPITTSHTYNNKTGELVLNWQPVLVPNVIYELEASGISGSYNKPTLSSRKYNKKSSGTVQYRVRSCTQYDGKKLCGSYSDLRSINIKYEGSGGGIITPPDRPCPTCAPYYTPIQPFNTEELEQGGSL